MERKVLTAAVFTAAVLLALAIVFALSVTGSLERVEKGCGITLPKESVETFCEKHVFDRSAHSKTAITVEIPAEKRESFAAELKECGWRSVPVGKTEETVIEFSKSGVDSRFGDELRAALAHPGAVYFSKDRFREIYPGIDDEFDNRRNVFFTFALYCPENGRLFYLEIDE